MNGTSSPAQISFRIPAVSIASCRDSMAQGPAIRKNGLSSPISKPATLMLRPSCCDPHQATLRSALPAARASAASR